MGPSGGRGGAGRPPTRRTPRSAAAALRFAASTKPPSGHQNGDGHAVGYPVPPRMRCEASHETTRLATAFGPTPPDCLHALDASATIGVDGRIGVETSPL